MYGTRDFSIPFEGEISDEFPGEPWATIPDQSSWPVAEHPKFHDLAEVDGMPAFGASRRQTIDESAAAHSAGTHSCRVPAHGRRRHSRGSGGLAARAGRLLGALAGLSATAFVLIFWVSAFGSLRDLMASHIAREPDLMWEAVVYGPWFLAGFSGFISWFINRHSGNSWVIWRYRTDSLHHCARMACSHRM
ncbi:hypothetical protein [Kitasatospora azatica]|uniref:hypothetical protein n=1 Tax=Kitasatospora azatica TaxID=58347 RepID=UPI00055FEC32|nr:hypothetical protein [Kitasatospora azatica]